MVMIIGTFFILIVRKKTLQTSIYFSMGMVCSNSAFIGFPLIEGLIGSSAAIVLAVALLVENVLLLPLFITLLTLSDKNRRSSGVVSLLSSSLLTLFKNPIIISIVLGIAYSFFQWELPSLLLKPVSMLAASSPAVALFVIGGSIAGMSFRGLFVDISFVMLGKLFLLPFTVMCLLMIFPPISRDLQVAVVVNAAMPMFSIYPLFGQQYQLDGFASAATVLTTVAAFFTLSALIAMVRVFDLLA
jgi:predicted permease